MDQVSKLFRKSKAHEFWIYIIFLTVFSASSLQQRPVEETYDLIHQVYDGTVTGSSFVSTTYFKNIGGQWAGARGRRARARGGTMGGEGRDGGGQRACGRRAGRG